MADGSLKSQAEKAELTAINRKAGLEQYENDGEIYANILEYFAKSNKGTLEKLKDAIDAGDIKLAYRTAHSLRGAAGTIGATGLVRAALEAEKAFAFMSGAEPGFMGEKVFDEHMMLLEKEFDSVFSELEFPAGEKEESRSRPGVVDRERTMELLDKLAPLLETGDTKCLEYLNETKEIFRPVAEEFKLFITQMELYDFKQAFETMNCIKRFMMP